ncbi:hypothetical protein ACPV5X_02200 [Legionella pneumophila]|uniref:hypothetical protein n=1 Tax=Legionella pneumophila TaxID=446 RepID=UPI003C9BCAFE
MNPEKSKSKTPEFDEEKKETALESAKVRCKVCFREISPKRLCGGHGGGGGGSDSTEK